jgi:hypothetical protein
MFAQSGGCQHVIKNAFYINLIVNAHAIGNLSSNTEGSLPLEADTGVTNKEKKFSYYRSRKGHSDHKRRALYKVLSQMKAVHLLSP